MEGTKFNLPRYLNLLLIGKTGAGKSALVNSILGRKAFESRSNFTSITVYSQKDVFELKNGRVVRVVDTPGVCDTGFTERQGRKMFTTAIREAIIMCPYGYNAVLLTIAFGTRLTQEDINVVSYLKRVFGPDSLSKHGIVVVTHGDNFTSDKDIDCPFAEWCQSQVGYFKELYQEVGGRVLLFDNRGSPDVQDEQRRELVAMVDLLDMEGGGKRYTNEKFDIAMEEYTRLEKELDTVNEDIMVETSLILAELDKLLKRVDFKDFGEKIDRMKILERRVKTHLSCIDNEPMSNMLGQAKSIVEQAEDKVEGELLSLTDAKNSSQPFRQEVVEATSASAKKGAPSECYLERSNTIKRLVGDFQKLRDKNNETCVQKLYRNVKMTFQAIYNWIFPPEFIRGERSNLTEKC